MIPQATSIRQTKYCDAIKRALQDTGHATNIELLALLKVQFPELTATTVHRATARLAGRHEIGAAPHTKDGSMRYDNNVSSHDHFVCNVCDTLRDADVKQAVAPILELAIGGCQISGRLTISGTCNRCINAAV